MADLPADLREALANQLAGVPAGRLRAIVARLVEAYRSGQTPVAPILAGPADVAGYAAYRMPATFAAVRSALATAAWLRPRTLLDLGGGTGAAAWAAAAVFDTIREITVVDQVGGALTFGASLAREAASPAVREARWCLERLSDPSAAPALVDLVTISYVLGELTAAEAAHVVDRAAAAGSAVVIVEPGTPAGYARILAARQRLADGGWLIVAPCPHQSACPLVAGDWCHFGARVNRSSLHRRVKDGELSYEDEKFSYLAAVSAATAQTVPPVGSGVVGSGVGGSGVGGLGASGSGPVGPGVGGRVLRRPVRRKGMVSLRLCRPDGTASEQIISKRHGDLYRIARDASWGDLLPQIPQ